MARRTTIIDIDADTGTRTAVLPTLDEVEAPRLRADLAVDRLEVPAGETVEVALQVLNTSNVIEEVQVRLLGLIADAVTVTPQGITLFPDESTSVTVALTFHRTLPAGEHEGLLVVSGASGTVAPAELPLRVVVPAAPAMTLLAEPPLRTAGRRARFDLLLDNDGNTPLHLQIRAADADRELGIVLSDATLSLRVDARESVELVALHRRPWTGPAVERVITIDVTGDDVAETAEVRFRQKPRLTAGVITILTLMVIVGLWALAMLFGVQAALAPTPPTKMLPETFVTGVGLEDLDPVTVGGSLSGTVTAASTAKPLARATVEAFDQQGQLVAATATGDDGTYVLEGLLPVRHRLRIRATGFDDRWWPDAAAAAGATPLLVSPTAPAEGIDSRLTGLPGALGGEVIAGDGDLLPITVEVLPLDLLEGATPITTTTDERGAWSVAGLAAPATYRITYRAEGYAPVEISQPLAGGEQVAVNTTRLPAAPGSITGSVIDLFGLPVGGVEIVAQRGGTSIDFTTPTSGEVGFFSLEDLETPGTYLLSLVAEGYAPETRAVRLGPGEVLEDLQIVIGPATGTVVGRALTSAGAVLGGVTVTVSGGGTVLTTDTLTSGSVGSFRLDGLPLPGIYAVTFSLDGFARETVRIELGDDVTDAFAEVRMRPSVGALAGRVVDSVTGAAMSAVEIEVSDGSTVRKTMTASVPLAEAGNFHVGDLAPGAYTVTARAPDGRAITVLQTVVAAATTEITLRPVSRP